MNCIECLSVKTKDTYPEHEKSKNSETFTDCFQNWKNSLIGKFNRYGGVDYGIGIGNIAFWDSKP